MYNHFLLPEVTIGLEMCEYTVIEGGSQNICGTLDGYLQRPIYVYLFIGSSSKMILVDKLVSTLPLTQVFKTLPIYRTLFIFGV